jgi:hypothetical protein
VTPKAVATRAEWLFELAAAGVGVGMAVHHAGLPRELVGRPVEGAALTHEINLTTKRGRLSTSISQLSTKFGKRSGRGGSPVPTA